MPGAGTRPRVPKSWKTLRILYGQAARALSPFISLYFETEWQVKGSTAMALRHQQSGNGGERGGRLEWRGPYYFADV